MKCLRCNNPAWAKGLCRQHYGAAHRDGTVIRVDPSEVCRLLLEEHMTLQQAGERLGVSRERIRQIIMAHAPTEWRLEKARKRRIREQQKVKETRSCRVCGAPTTRRASCSQRCGKIWLYLRSHIPETRKKQRLSAANWRTRNGVGRLDYAERLKKGLVVSNGRWLVAGSTTEEYAIMACKANWPIFLELEPKIQEYVRQLVEQLDRRK